MPRPAMQLLTLFQVKLTNRQIQMLRSYWSLLYSDLTALSIEYNRVLLNIYLELLKYQILRNNRKNSYSWISNFIIEYFYR